MRKQKKRVIIAILLIFLSIVFWAYNNFTMKKTIEKSHANQPDKVTLSNENCETIIQDNITTIQRYNGNAETVIIDKNLIVGKSLQIDSNAFLESGNLNKILIDKTIAGTDLEIKGFKINTNYDDEQYIEYITTREYSEAYEKYLELSEEEKSKSTIIPDKYEISMDVIYTDSMEENYQVSQLEETQLPEKFDLRDKINIKVENQGNTGICYAFASLTSVETNLSLIHNDYVDLSESHLASGTYQYAGGGFINADNKYYKERKGPIYQNEWPSVNSDIKAKRYVEETVNIPTINKSYIYTQEEVNTVRKIIKKHIIQYGSLYASISSTIKKNENNIYVLNAKFENYPDHAVSIIGWDDNFSKDNFPIGNRPNSNGAYLAVNSWGKDWGDNGCFWISYEDTWVESSLRGVVSVDTCQENMKIENMCITNNNTEKSYKLTRGVNAKIEIDVNINEIKNNQEQIIIDVISPSGEQIAKNIPISGNKIENGKSKIILDFKTSELPIGEYSINLKYDDEIISIPIIITLDSYDFEIKEDGTINIIGYYGKDKQIIIPEKIYEFTVTGISSGAFINSDLESITIYDNITEIGENIIDKSVIIYGNSGTYIEQYASENEYIFIDLNKNITEGNGWYFDTEDNKLFILENLPNKEYDYLKKLIHIVELKEPITEIFESQFKGYENLEEVILSDSVTTMGKKAFSECYNLKKVNLSQNINTIESQTFYNCKKLENIVIPDGVQAIGDAVFYGCTNLKNINIPKGVTVIENETFLNCINLEKINIPIGITTIKDRAFYGCTNLDNLKMPSTLTTIGNNVFYGCIVNEVIEYGTIDAELPNLIKRAVTSGDILNCGTGITVKNGKINANTSKLEVNPACGEIIITISSGKLSGLKVIIVVSGVIEYSDYEWTNEDIIAKIYVGKGEHILNNGGDSVYKFSENGEFEFEYINLNGENKKVIAKAENIDKTLPSITTTLTKNEQGFIESINANIIDGQSGLWSSSSIGYAWTTSNTNKPTDWTMVEIPKFTNGTKDVTFEIDIEGLSGKYYLWIYKNAFYDMASNGYEKEVELISSEPYYLGNEPILQPEITSDKYFIQDEYILKIQPKTTVNEICQKIQSNIKFDILNLDGKKAQENNFVGTGYKVRFEEGTEYTLIVWGDFTGDGKISIAELARASRIAVEPDKVSTRDIKIVDVSMDGNIKITDLAAISRLAVQ